MKSPTQKDFILTICEFSFFIRWFFHFNETRNSNARWGHNFQIVVIFLSLLNLDRQRIIGKQIIGTAIQLESVLW
jgi:hypothetical protein